MKKEIFTKGTSQVITYENHDGGSIIYIPQSRIDEENVETVANRIKKLTGKKPWKAVFFTVGEWNNDLSPWKGRDSKGEDTFGGYGKDTLNFISGELIPATEGDKSYENRYIAGYSLAGLFALWAAFESDIFNGCASASGSLWFDGWDEYIRNTVVNRPMSIYLSLGLKEEKTKDPLMSLVGDRTRMTHEILSIIEGVNTTLVMNPGGHFTEPDIRLATGISWLINN